MKLHSCLGGIDVKSNRELSKNCEITSLVPENYLVYPLIPYKNKIPHPCVEVGDKIKIGQQIARASDGTLGLYSSVSGKVSVIEDRKGFDLNIYK